MASKQFTVDGIGNVTLFKRKGMRYLRISLDSRGGVRVTLPTWVPYNAGLKFLETKRQWILDNAQVKQSFKDGQRIGKAHKLVFLHHKEVQKPTSRISGNTVFINVPRSMLNTSEPVQLAAEKAALRALKKEAETLLPQRLATLARQHGFSYKSVSVKKLKSRWGSCNSHKEIVLNLYLVQLPWHLIDYVILHELTHTKVLAHGKPFWDEMGKYLTNLKELRKEMKQYQAHILQQTPLSDTQGM